jgi:shikimate kinase
MSGARKPSGPDNVFLTGFMGSGKSTVGPLLARARGSDFVDTDTWIERVVALSVADIFARQGEPAFRELEAKAIAQVCAREGQVIALGGGALVHPESLALVRQRGVLVYLRTSTEELVQRLKPEIGYRPLLAGVTSESELAARISRLRAARESLYTSAHFIVDTDGRKPETVASLIQAALLNVGRDGVVS